MEVVDWWRFQKVTRKRPKWIALHLSVLANRNMRNLSDYAWRLLVGIWLLRSELGCNVPLDPKYIAQYIGLTHTVHTKYHIKRFIELGFLRVSRSEIAPVERQDRTGQDSKSKTLVAPDATSETSKPTRKVSKAKTYSAAFELFWSIQRKKVGKWAAFLVWETLRKAGDLPSHGVLAAAYERYLCTKPVLDGFVLDPRTWLSQRRWEDETPAPTTHPDAALAFSEMDYPDPPAPGPDLLPCREPGCAGYGVIHPWCNKHYSSEKEVS